MKTLIFKIRQFPHLSETFIIAQIITAIKCGFDVRVLVSEVLDFEKSTHGELLKKHSIEDKIIVEDYKIPKNKIFRLLIWIVKGLKNIHQLEKVIQFHKHKPKFSLTWLYQFDFYNMFKNVDVIHVQYGTNRHPVDVLKKTGFLKGKLIVSFHGHDAFFPINGIIPNDGYYDVLFKYGDLIIANTPYLANQLKSLSCPEEKIRIIPVGVDTDFFKPKELKKAGTTCKLITVGRLDKVKGHHLAIDSVHSLLNEGIKVSLTIIGEGKERYRLEELIKSKELESSVFITGSKSQSEVREYLWHHDIYIFCAIALEDQRRETQGLATIEAQACGLPVVLFDSGGVKYTISINQSGFLVPEGDVSLMTEKIKELVNSYELRNKMGRSGIEFVKKTFSFNVLQNEWKTIYSS